MSSVIGNFLDMFNNLIYINTLPQSDPLFLYLAAQHIHTPLEADDYLSLFRGVQRDPGVNNYRKQGLAMIYALDLVSPITKPVNSNLG